MRCLNIIYRKDKEMDNSYPRDSDLIDEMSYLSKDEKCQVCGEEFKEGEQVVQIFVGPLVTDDILGLLGVEPKEYFAWHSACKKEYGN